MRDVIWRRVAQIDHDGRIDTLDVDELIARGRRLDRKCSDGNKQTQRDALFQEPGNHARF